jgi:hypothetical protein
MPTPPGAPACAPTSYYTLTCCGRPGGSADCPCGWSLTTGSVAAAQAAAELHAAGVLILDTGHRIAVVREVSDLVWRREDPGDLRRAA